MNEPWIALLVFVTTSLLTVSVGTLVYDGLFRYRLAVRERLKEFAGETAGERSVSLFRDMNRLHGHEFVEYQRWDEWIRQQFDQANIKCSIRAFVLLCLASGLTTALLGAFYSWWLSGLFGSVGTLLPFGFVNLRKRQCQRKLCRQLPEAFAMISRAVKSGQTIPSALQIIAEDFESPISTEFARCHEQQNLGISRESALRQLAKRTGIMELQIFVVALLVQTKSGGDLVELLDNLSTMIRRRLKLKERVRALTGEGRMQALVLLILPVAAMAGIIVLSPKYADTLLDRPWLLMGTATAQVIGALWIQRIVNFEY